MKDIEVFKDGSWGTCTVEVLSAPFSGATEFTFDEPPLAVFIDQLVVIEQTLTGDARLGQQYEEPHVALHGDGLGHVTVSGVIAEYRDHTQRLEFSFATDQTALGPFIEGLRQAL